MHFNFFTYKIMVLCLHNFDIHMFKSKSTL